MRTEMSLNLQYKLVKYRQPPLLNLLEYPSTDKREASNQKEPLTPEQLLDLEQSRQYKEELKQADMVQACIEKTKLESQEAELIRLRALKA